MLLIFQAVGTVAEPKDKLNKKANGRDMLVAVDFSIIEEIPSGPEVDLFGNDFKTFSTSLGMMIQVSSTDDKSYVTGGGFGESELKHEPK
jgi:hypothetical protein